MDLPDHLRTAARERRLIPFIGAGFSANLKLPTWSQLIDQAAKTLRMDADVARTYGDFLQMAEFLEIKQGGIGELRSALDKAFNDPAIDISASKRHMLLTKMKAPAIYTTNWDNLIERAFESAKIDFNKIVTVSDMVKASPERANIVKYHGDFSHDETLVFTESSYFRRLDLESPLDLRFRSDILGRTLLFLGYSFSDINIRYLWYRLTQILDEQLGPRHTAPYGYIVSHSRNPVFQEVCGHSRNIAVIDLDPRDRDTALVDLLNELVSETTSA